MLLAEILYIAQDSAITNSPFGRQQTVHERDSLAVTDDVNCKDLREQRRRHFKLSCNSLPCFPAFILRTSLSIACKCSRGNWSRVPRLARTFFPRENAGAEMNSADMFSAENLPCGYAARCDVSRCNDITTRLHTTHCVVWSRMCENAQGGMGCAELMSHRSNTERRTSRLQSWSPALCAGK